MSEKIISIEGILVREDGSKRGRIEINPQTGIIEKIGEETGSADLVFEDELIFPGFIDLHVHARECVDHTQDYKEDFETASLAAINGGVVAFVEMPNNPTPPIDDESYLAKKELSKKSKVETVLYAGIGEGTSPLSFSVPYKVYMGPSVGSLFFKSLEALEEVISKYRGCEVSFHCEDPKILEENKNKPTHIEKRPKEAELSAIDFAISVIEKYDISGKICHLSTKEGVLKIKNAKDKGIKILAEASPHQLFFDENMITRENENLLQMNPPVRPHEDREFLISALREGIVDFIATDHAPHTIEEKLKGTSGTPQLDTYGLVATWLMREFDFTAQDILRVCSKNPGKFISKFTEIPFGEIKEGYAGSFSVIDLKTNTKVTKEILKTKCGWSTYEGFSFPGRVTHTIIIKGKVYEK